jgi:Flp pilus assembly protein TadG
MLRHRRLRSVTAGSTYRLPHQLGRSRRAVILVEFLLVFPILFITTLATFQFGIVAIVNQAVVAAATEGAREAAKIGATTDEIATVIDDILSVHQITFDPTATNATDDARVVIEYGAPISTTVERGNTTLNCTAVGPAVGTDEVKVTVCVRLTDATGCYPVPNWLSTFGFDLTGCTFEISSLANVE